jgi:putative N6-adenine-specific DNA methylase
MNDLQLFLPCAAGVETYLATEVRRILNLAPSALQSQRGGVGLRASWRDAMLLNLHSRLAQRVLVQLSETPYRHEQDIYEGARAIAWELWFTNRQTFKIEITAQYSPLKSLNFAALRVKDAVADRFRELSGVRPSVEVRWPDARVYVHLTQDRMILAIDTSGEPLFKRGWRTDKGDAPLKETLAAAMLAASGWSQGEDGAPGACEQGQALYDPCCGSGTIAIEAAQIACNIAPGSQRRFGFEKLVPFQPHVWSALLQQARSQQRAPAAQVYGSDVSFRMVDFAQNNADRAGVGQAVHLRGGDALQRMPPGEAPGLVLVNPPYGERISAAGVAGRQQAQTEAGGDFFVQLASHWKKNFPGWTAWVLTPDLKLPGHMRLKESRRVPLWNGPIECRMFRFDLVAGRMKS